LLYVLLNAFSPYLEDEISFYGAENSRQSKVYTTILNSKAFNNLMSSIGYFYDIDKSRTVNSGDERGIVTVHTYSRKGNNNV
jgi:hypothetical protein